MSMFSMHVHQNRYAFQAYSQDHYPAQISDRSAHDWWTTAWTCTSAMATTRCRESRSTRVGRSTTTSATSPCTASASTTAGLTGPDDAPSNRGEEGNQWLQQSSNQSAYVTRNTYQDGVLQEIRIYPVDLGGAPGPSRRPWSRTDVPMTPTPARAREILAQIQEVLEAVRNPDLDRSRFLVSSDWRHQDCQGRSSAGWPESSLDVWRTERAWRSRCQAPGRRGLEVGIAE